MHLLAFGHARLRAVFIRGLDIQTPSIHVCTGVLIEQRVTRK